MDIEKLKALALAATSGPWVDGGHTVYQADEVGDELICKQMGAEDSAYVAAANPAAVLELIAEVERYRKLKADDFTSEYCEYTSNRLNGFEEFDLDGALDAAIEKEKA
jgi:hypothetical protein